MTNFDQEINLFSEIKNKYKPVAGYHLVLDLDAYRVGSEIILQFSFDSEDYFKFVNIEVRNKNKEIVIITSNGDGFIEYDSSKLFILYNYKINEILIFYDKTPSPYRINRSLKQQMLVLAHDLTYPKLKKPCS